MVVNNDLNSLLSAGLADATATLSSAVRVLRGKSVIAEGDGVLVESSAQLTAELGGAIYTITARATIARAICTTRPRGGDTLSAAGNNYLIVACNSSPWDNAYYLQLTTV